MRVANIMHFLALLILNSTILYIGIPAKTGPAIVVAELMVMRHMLQDMKRVMLSVWGIPLMLQLCNRSVSGVRQILIPYNRMTFREFKQSTTAIILPASVNTAYRCPI